MILKLEHKFKKDVKFEQVNNYLHSMFSDILFSNSKKENKKVSYSFKISRLKNYYQNKNYDIYFNSSDLDMLSLLEKNALKYNTKILTEMTSQISSLIKISNINFEIYDIVLKNWNIDSDLIGKKRRIDYKKEFSIELLKELIMYQVYNDLPITLKNQITPNSITKNNKDYFDFIDSIILGAERKVIIKNNFVTAYDIVINIKSDKKSKILGNQLVHNGSGAKNSFGLGYAEYYKL